mgnify:CR=1 FL=1
MRHLQAILEESEEIANRIDRETRQLQIEAAVQEAILFGNRYRELKEQGIDPLHLVNSAAIEEFPQQISKIQSLAQGHDHCRGCGELLDKDLDFCAACGEKR